MANPKSASAPSTPLPEFASRSKLMSGEKPTYLGFGLGLRPQHYSEILEHNPPIDWFEFISEDYLTPGGTALRMLDRIRARYPLVMHGVSLSIASTDELKIDYLKELKALATRIEPQWISDHLCWTGIHGIDLHGLLPIPYTGEALEHIVSRVHFVQDFLGCAITLENVSAYARYGHSEMTEWQFLAELTRRTGCWLLLDISNVYISSFNHGYDPGAFIRGIPGDRVVQFHLAGHRNMDTHIIDTHDRSVCDDVWHLYGQALECFGPTSIMIERDENIPPLAELVEELAHARAIAAQRCPRMDDKGRENESGAANTARFMTSSKQQTSLRELQERFQEAIISGGEVAFGDLAEGAREKREVLLDVYRDTYVVGLLRRKHELLRAYMGGDFDDMARYYIAANPSPRRNAHWYASHLPSYLRETAPYSRNLELAEIALIEKSLYDASDAEDAPVLDLAHLADIAPERWARLRFQPHPSVVRLDLATNAAAIWSALKDATAPPAVVHPASPAYLIVWRNIDTASFRVLDAEEAVIWDEASKSVAFGALCQMLATDHDADSAVERAARYLQGWISSRLLSAACIEG